MWKWFPHRYVVNEVLQSFNVWDYSWLPVCSSRRFELLMVRSKTFKMNELFIFETDGFNIYREWISPRRKQQSYQMKKEVNSILTCNQIDKNNKQKTNQKKTKVLSHVTFHVWHVYGVCLKLTSPFTRWNRLSLSETNTVLLLLHIAADWEWVIITIAFIVLYNE